MFCLDVFIVFLAFVLTLHSGTFWTVWQNAVSEFYKQFGETASCKQVAVTDWGNNILSTVWGHPVMNYDKFSPMFEHWPVLKSDYSKFCGWWYMYMYTFVHVDVACGLFYWSMCPFPSYPWKKIDNIYIIMWTSFAVLFVKSQVVKKKKKEVAVSISFN